MRFADEYGWDHSGYSTQAYAQYMALVDFVKAGGRCDRAAGRPAEALQVPDGAPLLDAETGLNCIHPPSQTIPTACKSIGVLVEIQPDKSVRALTGSFIEHD